MYAKYPNCNHPPLFSLCIVEITPKGKLLEGVHVTYFADHFKFNWVYPHSALDSNQKIPFSVFPFLFILLI